MNALIRDRMLRAGVVQALAEVLAVRSHASVAALVGCDRATVGRRGGETMDAWPTGQFLTLAAEDAQLGEAVRAFLAGMASEAQSGELMTDLFRMLGQAGALVRELAATLADGRVDRSEARRVLTQVQEARRDCARAEQELKALLKEGV